MNLSTHEITHEVASTPDKGRLNAEEFRTKIANEFGIDADTAHDRMRQLKELSVEGVAILLEEINKTVMGSDVSQVSHDTMIKIGGKDTVAPEDRYGVFLQLIEDIKNTDEQINPARVADTLALGVVLLHPFEDGNGRTARTIGLLFRDEYTDSDYEANFAIAAGSRDQARKNGGWMVNGYIPRIMSDQSDPSIVEKYLKNLLKYVAKESYESPFGGVAPLYDTRLQKDRNGEFEDRYDEFRDDISAH